MTSTATTYTEYKLVWQDIPIKLRHCRSWLCNDGSVQHIELHSQDNDPLPVTETGYRSHFLCGQNALAEFDDDPVIYTLAWLDRTATATGWQRERQLRLF